MLKKSWNPTENPGIFKPLRIETPKENQTQDQTPGVLARQTPKPTNPKEPNPEP